MRMLSIQHTPGPTVLITLSDLPLGAATLLVERIWGDTVETVRESVNVLPSGGAAVVRDYEPPLGWPVTYRISTFAADGSHLSAALEGPIATPEPDDPNNVWVMDGLDPAGAILLPMMADTEQGVEHTSPGFGLSDPITGGLPVAALRSRNHTTRPYVFATQGREQGLGFAALVGRGGVLVVRPALSSGVLHPTGIIRLAAASVQRPLHIPWSGWARWTVSGVEVAPDAWPELVPLVTWQDWADDMPDTTWADYATTHPGRTWHDIAANGW